MATGPEDLFELADEFLGACIDALDTIPTYAPALAGAPERTFVSPGRPAFDCCDQLAVHVETITSDPVQPLKNSTRTNMVQLIATATRCIPALGENGQIPTATELSSSAEQLDADGWALWNHIFNLIRAEQLFTLCGVVIWEGLRAINPQGGCGGWTLVLRVDLDGYEEVIAT